MPRPIKCRKVCHFPNVLEFLPADDTEKKTPIVLTVDEYETIRLLDKKGYSQEQCAASMQVARTTVQRIYEIARKKIADALIDGHPLKIEGGDFRICDGQSGNDSYPAQCLLPSSPLQSEMFRFHRTDPPGYDLSSMASA